MNKNCPSCGESYRPPDDTIRRSVLCRFCEPTEVKWLARGVRCFVFHCRFEEAVRGKSAALVASGHVRIATKNDVVILDAPVSDQIIEGADYVNVRSCYCNNKNCAYYESS